MRVARTWRLTLLALLSVAVPGAQLAGPVAAHASSQPTVTITSPGNASTIKGAGFVHAIGSVDQAGTDSGVSMQLFIDGDVSGSAVSCPTGAGTADCALDLPYDFTGMSGSHVFDVTFVTAQVTAGVGSADVAVNVTLPPPTVTVSAPASSGSIVKGVTSITGTGTVDASQTDWPTSLQLYVDGVARGSAYTCPSAGPSHKTCSTNTFSYDFTGMTGSHDIVIRMVTSRIPSTDSPTLTVNAQSPAPTAAISSPAAGVYLTGVITISDTGTVDASQNDSGSTMQLVVDGSPQGTATSCPAGSKTCSPSFSYDASGMTGSKSFVVRFTTLRGRQVDSDPVTVNVSSPAPTAVVTSPTNNAGVSGLFSVTATGTVDSSQTDFGKTLQLYVDGSPVGSAVSCPSQTSRTCTLSTLSWDATGVTGTHTLSVLFTTTSLRTATSGNVSVTVSSPGPTAVVQTPSLGSTVSGTVTVTGQGTVASSQSDTPATLQLYVDNVAQGSPVACGASSNPKLCPGSFTWDATGLTGTHYLSVRFVTGSAVAVLSAARPVNVVSPAPVVVITSPAASSTVAGAVTVTGTATVDAGQTDTPHTLQLWVDGIAAGDAVTCPTGGATPKTCAAGLPWDVTGLSGNHVVQLRVATTRGVATLSAGVPVTVANPAPAVTITAPAAGGTVRDTVVIAATGSVDPAQSDTAASMALTVDGVPLGDRQACSGKSCAASFSWATAGLAGSHTIAVSLTTAKGRTSTVAEKVFVFSGTTITLTPVKVTAHGHVATVKGTLKATANGRGVSGGVVSLTFAPAVGAKRTVAVHTDSLGRFSYGWKAAATTTVTAVPAATPYWGASKATLRLAVTAGIACPTVRLVHGVTGKGVCKVPDLLKGSKVSLQYKVGSRWVTVGSAKATAGKVTWTLKLARAGTYSVRVVVAANRGFAATVGAPAKVVVR